MPGCQSFLQSAFRRWRYWGQKFDQSCLPRPFAWQVQKAHRACRYLESRCWRSWIHPLRAVPLSCCSVHTLESGFFWKNKKEILSVVIVCDRFQQGSKATDGIQIMVLIRRVASLTSSSHKRQPEKRSENRRKIIRKTKSPELVHRYRDLGKARTNSLLPRKMQTKPTLCSAISFSMNALALPSLPSAGALMALYDDGFILFGGLLLCINCILCCCMYCSRLYEKSIAIAGGWNADMALFPISVSVWVRVKPRILRVKKSQNKIGRNQSI